MGAGAARKEVLFYKTNKTARIQWWKEEELFTKARGEQLNTRSRRGGPC